MWRSTFVPETIFRRLSGRRIEYLTIIPWTRMDSESIAHEAEDRMGYWLRGRE